MLTLFLKEYSGQESHLGEDRVRQEPLEHVDN